MIERVIIKNFQCHKDTDISFSEGLNVLSGTSDNGKSSVLRAMLWLALNRPSGDSIKNWDAGDEEVSVTIFLDGESITKTRKGNRSKYELSSGEEFEAFKTDVPAEVLSILDLSDFNIQTQHQPYFLLNDSPGEVAKKMNDMIGLDIIDYMFKNINSKIIESKRESDRERINVDRLTSEIDALSYLDGLGNKIDQLDSVLKQQDILLGKITAIADILTAIKDTEERLKKLTPILSAEPLCKEIYQDIAKFSSNASLCKPIAEIIEDIQDTNGSLVIEKEWIKVEAPYLEIRASLKESTVLKASTESLDSILSSISLVGKKKKQEEEVLELVREKFKKALKDNKVCPFCYNDMDDKTIGRLTK